MSARDLVMADLVDALIRERLLGFDEGAVEEDERGERWYRVAVREGAGGPPAGLGVSGAHASGGSVRMRIRDGGALQPLRLAPGPVLHAERELTPDELLALLADPALPGRARVLADLRAAVEHAGVVRAGRRADVPDGPHAASGRRGAAVAARPAVALLAGERLAATRGRPFHPTARAASGWSAAELAEYGAMRRAPLGLDWVAVRAERLRFGGGAGAERLPALLLDAEECERLGSPPLGYRLLPVHPWQLAHALPREFAAELAAGHVRVVARGVGRFHPTAALRTLASAANPALHVKLPLGIATLGAMRLLPPRYLANGERAEAMLRALTDRDPVLRRRVAVCDERTWCGWAGDEFADRPGQLAAQARRYPPDVLDDPDVLALPMAALAADGWEAPASDPAAFFGELARAFCAVGLSFLRYGVLPELHGQNVVVMLRDGAVERFVLRDHDAVRLYPAWMAAAGVPDPGYRIRPGSPQSLRLDSGEALAGYLQTLGFQVNLYGIADALCRHHGVAERALWERLREALVDALAALDLPARVRTVVEHRLLHAPTWPSREVLGPLLHTAGPAGMSMPAATGAVPNPLAPGGARPGVPAAGTTPDSLELARGAARRRLLNAFLRETGVHDVRLGMLRVPLAASDRTLVVEVRHASPAGHHAYGDAALAQDVEGRCAPLSHDDLVDALLAELESTSGARARALATQIEASVARTARYLRRGRSPAPRGGDAHALTRHAEQSVLLGHPFHPTPKSAEGFADEELERYAPELAASFALHYLAVAPRLVAERRIAPGAWLPDAVTDGAPAGYALLPVHPWQARRLLAQPAVAALIAGGELVALGPRGPRVHPTSSVRTVCAPGFATAWKLPLHVRITNFVRTNPTEHVRRATDAGALIARCPPRPGFGVLLESGFRGLDPDVVGEGLAADTAVLFREHPFTAAGLAPRVLAGLLDGEPPELMRCVRAAGDAEAWLRRYLELALRPLLALFARDGVSLEAHVQNTLLATEGGWPVHVWVRDMEGAGIDRERVRGALPAGSPALYDRAEAWLRLRYNAVTNQLGHVVAAIGRHGDVPEPRLWAAARDALAGWPDAEPCASELRSAPTLPAKANLVSRLAERGERPLYVEVPNPLRGA